MGMIVEVRDELARIQYGGVPGRGRLGGEALNRRAAWRRKSLSDLASAADGLMTVYIYYIQ